MRVLVGSRQMVWRMHVLGVGAPVYLEWGAVLAHRLPHVIVNMLVLLANGINVQILQVMAHFSKSLLVVMTRTS